jgi:L,D-peptidoglycan transpeptidase YkuD (ErfK/YbiS/YcfS/YnhG family)
MYKNLVVPLIVLAPLLLCGCSHFSDGYQARAAFREANHFVSQGNYPASLGSYQQIIEKYPASADRALFEMGIVSSHPANELKDYQKSLEYFHKLSTSYPESLYKKDSDALIVTINNVILKDKTIAVQQDQIAALRAEVDGRKNETVAMQDRLATLAQEVRRKENENSKLQHEIFILKKRTADRILIEKKERRMTLLAQGKVIKTYQIALGGNPVGPKERQGDNKTPEGIYVIDAVNKGSSYHLALHISYPNAKDRKRAKQLGVAPGGDIMIHGIKNGFSWVGDMHANADWTQGCIAVTNAEIEEIEMLAPLGTIVDIRP